MGKCQRYVPTGKISRNQTIPNPKHLKAMLQTLKVLVLALLEAIYYFAVPYCSMFNQVKGQDVVGPSCSPPKLGDLRQGRPESEVRNDDVENGC